MHPSLINSSTLQQKTNKYISFLLSFFYSKHTKKTMSPYLFQVVKAFASSNLNWYVHYGLVFPRNIELVPFQKILVDFELKAGCQSSDVVVVKGVKPCFIKQ